METSCALRDALCEIVGTSGILQDEHLSDYSYDGIVPNIVVMPASVGEVQAVLRFASEQNLTVLPAGAGTKLGIGNYTQKTDFVLSTFRLNRVVQYEPADLTVTVETGIRLTDLQTELAKHQQFFPIDPPFADRCTIGGIIATNYSGPGRLRSGTSRNLVLGMKVVHASGTVVKSGGKVVKNVAGYDLNKLYIGSFGTLGIITEVSLKLAPLPKRQVIISAQFSSIAEAVNIGLNIVRSQTLPTFVNLNINNRTDPFIVGKPMLLIGFGGEPETVSWQISSTQTRLEQNCVDGVKIYEGASQECLKSTVQDFSAVENGPNTVVIRVHLKRTDITEFAAIVLDDDYEMMVLLGNGVLYLKKHLDPGADCQSVAESLEQLRLKALSVQGNLIIEHAHPQLKQLIDVWGPIGSTLKLMKQVKEKFDSGSILNPRRFVAGI